MTTGRVDTKRPIATDRHSSALIAERLIFEAKAAPAIPDIKAWLSLVGIPKKQVADAHIMTETSEQHNDISADFGSLPKFAMP